MPGSIGHELLPESLRMIPAEISCVNQDNVGQPFDDGLSISLKPLSMPGQVSLHHCK